MWTISRAVGSRVLPVAMTVGALCQILHAHQVSSNKPRAFFTLTLATSAREVLLLEPMPLTITLENATSGPLEGHSALDFSSGRLEVEITPEGGSPRVTRDLSAFTADTFVPRKLIEPGARFQVHELLTVGLAHQFPRPGSYTVRVRVLGLDTGPVGWSNPVSLVVTQPEGLNREAYDYIVATRREDVFLAGVTLGGPEDAFDQLERFANLYADTPYGDYAAFRVGARYHVRKDEPRARPYLERVANKPVFRQWGESVAMFKRAGLIR